MTTLINSKRTGFQAGGSKARPDRLYYATFEATFEGMPELEDYNEAGRVAGYHPSAYGPMYPVSLRKEGDKHTVTFRCRNNSD